MSEKFDGVRCFWDGKKLFSGRGNLIKSPKWFTDSLPEIALDGELWYLEKSINYFYCLIIFLLFLLFYEIFYLLFFAYYLF